MNGTVPRLGRVGIWSLELRFGDAGKAAEAIGELDELGFGAVWVPGGVGGDVTGDLDRLLKATKRVTLATGIINIWKHEPKDIAGWWKGLPADKQSRVFLGLGVSHGPLIGDEYKHPLAMMRDYLDRLAKEGMPGNSLCIAALAPKMLELSRERTAGTHPYLVTPAHSTVARKALGPGKIVAPEQGVVLTDDVAKGRALAREALTTYRQLPNYLNNWRRLGFAEDDIANASDKLIDGLFAIGDTNVIAERVKAHHAAGADHVCLQAITGAQMDLSVLRKVWRELAKALL